MKYEDVKMGMFVKTTRETVLGPAGQTYVVHSRNGMQGYAMVRIPGTRGALWVPIDAIEPTEWPAA